MAGLEPPVQPMEHHYPITERIDAVAGHGSRLPAGMDYEANIYFRQERQGMLPGACEPGGTPRDFGHELLQPDPDRVADRLEMSFERIPAIGEAGIKDIVNGPFTFGPDGNPMIGPVPGMRNYRVAVGVMAGFCQGSGVGLCMAEWMIDGEPSIDVRAMDVAHFGDFATPDRGTVKSTENCERRFVMTFPNETLPKGRMQKTTALYDRLVAKGARMGQGFGLENARWLADSPEDAWEEPTFGRNRSHGYVAREVKAVMWRARSRRCVADNCPPREPENPNLPDREGCVAPAHRNRGVIRRRSASGRSATGCGVRLLPADGPSRHPRTGG